MKSVSAPRSVASPLRWLVGLAALVVGATAVWFAARYPILPALALGLWVAWVVACYRSPLLWVGVVPALLPVLGFAPWTGWLVVEELDFLLAGVVFAGFGRIALAVGAAGTGQHASGPGNGTRIPLVSLVLLVALVGTSSIAAVRGVLDAAPTDAGFTQGYFDPLNSLRLLQAVRVGAVGGAAFRREPACGARAHGRPPGHRDGDRAWRRRDGCAVGTGSVSRRSQLFGRLPHDQSVLGDARRGRGPRRLSGAGVSVRARALPWMCAGARLT